MVKSSLSLPREAALCGAKGGKPKSSALDRNIHAKYFLISLKNLILIFFFFLILNLGDSCVFKSPHHHPISLFLLGSVPEQEGCELLAPPNQPRAPSTACTQGCLSPAREAEGEHYPASHRGNDIIGAVWI